MIKKHKNRLKNSIQNLLSNTQSQIINTITQSIINITHNIVQQQIATVSSSNESKNELSGSNIYIGSGATFSIEQQNNLKSTVEAILKISISNELILKLSSQIKEDVAATLSQNAELSNKIAASSALLKAQQNSGEFNNALNKAKDSINTLVSNLTRREDNTIIKNKILNSINLSNESTATIQDYVSTLINENISQKTLNNCVQNNTLLNLSNLNQIIVQGAGSSFEIIQGNILESFYNCVISTLITSEDLQMISSDVLTNASFAANQGASTSVDLTADKTNNDTNTSKSFVDSLGAGLVIALVIIVIIIIIIIK